jgi:hypothetical protein
MLPSEIPQKTGLPPLFLRSYLSDLKSNAFFRAFAGPPPLLNMSILEKDHIKSPID